MKDFISWDLIDDCVTEIAFHLKDTGKDFTGVFGIPRGGSLLAVMLSHKLDLPYIENIDSVNKDVIIIDDIADTGETLKKYKSHPVSEKSYYVTIHEHEQSIVKPEYSVINKGDKWIVYPWETTNSEEIQDYLK
jgi:uncharacterized protein